MYSAPARYQVRGPMINLILAPGTGQASSFKENSIQLFNQHHYESLAERGSLLYSDVNSLQIFFTLTLMIVTEGLRRKKHFTH